LNVVEFEFKLRHIPDSHQLNTQQIMVMLFVINTHLVSKLTSQQKVMSAKQPVSEIFCQWSVRTLCWWTYPWQEEVSSQRKCPAAFS